MENRNLQCSDRRFRNSPSKNRAQLLENPGFGALRSFRFGKDIESKLPGENLALDLLKIQQVICLFLKFVDSRVPAFRGRLEERYGRGSHDKGIVQAR